MIREFTLDEPGIWDQLNPLLLAHWEEVQQNSPNDKFLLTTKMYESSHKLKMLWCVGAYEEGSMVGYYAAILVPSWHTADCKIAQDLGWFVKKEYRKGLIGVRLVKEIEKVIAREGCTENAISIKILKYNRPEKLLLKMGYEITEHRLTKQLKVAENA